MKTRTILSTTIFILTFLLLPSIAFSQDYPPQVLWEKFYGGLEDDISGKMSITADSGFVMVGCTKSFGAGNNDIYLVKTDLNGDTLWTRTYGGPNSDRGYGIDIFEDQSIIIASSYNFQSPGGGDACVIKVDEFGDSLWSKSYGGNQDDQAWDIRCLPNMGFIMIGSTQSFGAGSYDIYLVKADLNGDTLWTRTYGGPYYDVGASIDITEDGGYILTGSYREVPLEYKLFIIKVDSLGNEQWTHLYGYGTNPKNAGLSIKQDNDGGYIAIGYTETSNIEERDIYVVKVDLNVDTLWTRTYGGSDFDTGNSILPLEGHNGYLLTGTTRSYGSGLGDAYMMRINSDGDTLWTSLFGYENDDASSYLVKYFCNSYMLLGTTKSQGAGNIDYWLLKLVFEGNGVKLKKKFNKSTYNLFAAPNPFNPSTTISFNLPKAGEVSLKVFDIAGREVANLIEGKLSAGEHRGVFDGSDLASGIYFARLQTNGLKQIVKLLLIK